jgi:hypothetical protein
MLEPHTTKISVRYMFMFFYVYVYACVVEQWRNQEFRVGGAGRIGIIDIYLLYLSSTKASRDCK